MTLHRKVWYTGKAQKDSYSNSYFTVIVGKVSGKSYFIDMMK